jgi:hypothetical protein
MECDGTDKILSSAVFHWAWEIFERGICIELFGAGTATTMYIKNEMLSLAVVLKFTFRP